MKVGDKVSIPVEHIITAIGGPKDEAGNLIVEKAECSLVPVDAHVNHVTVKLSDLLKPAA